MRTREFKKRRGIRSYWLFACSLMKYQGKLFWSFWNSRLNSHWVFWHWKKSEKMLINQFLMQRSQRNHVNLRRNLGAFLKMPISGKAPATIWLTKNDDFLNGNSVVQFSHLSDDFLFTFSFCHLICHFLFLTHFFQFFAWEKVPCLFISEAKKIKYCFFF